MLESLRDRETRAEVACCPDKHYRRLIWGIGPYIADYPEQVLLACIVMNWCARYVTMLFCIVTEFTLFLDVKGTERTLMANYLTCHATEYLQKSSWQEHHWAHCGKILVLSQML